MRAAGVVDGLLAGLLFGVMAFLVRHARFDVPSAELVFVRSLAGLIVFAPLVRGRFRSVFGRGTRILWIRAFAGTAAMLAFYWNLQHASVGTAKTFTMLAPVLLAILSSPVLGESLSRRELTAIAIAILGAAALYLPSSASPTLHNTVAGFGGAACTCIALLALRRAAAKHSSAVVVWTFSLVCACGALVFAGSDWTIPSGTAAALTLGVAITGVAAQIFMTRAFRQLRAPIASGLIITSLIWGVACEVLFEGFLPSPFELFAYALVLGGVYRLRGTAEPAPVRPIRGPKVPSDF